MNKAPERIWAFYAPEISEDEGGATIVAHETLQLMSTEYVREDIHEALKAERDAYKEAVHEFQESMRAALQEKT